MWRVSKISDVEYEIVHRAGKDNEDADSISRHPMLGARSLLRVGADVALNELLTLLPEQNREITKWWVWAGRDTVPMERIVQDYKSDRSKIYVRAPKESFNNPAWQVAVLMPRTENATEVARKAIDDGRPACVLMPTELVYYTAQERDGTFGAKYVNAIKEAKKLTLMATDTTWLCLGTGIPANDVRSGETNTRPPGPAAGWTPAVGSLEEWRREQKESVTRESKGMDVVHTDESGLIMMMGKDNVPRVYVPDGRREALIKMHHEGNHHLAANKTYVSLHRYFDWPSARIDVRKYYATCTFCELSKATRNITHKRSRAIESMPPRSRYGMDYYGVGDGEVLGIMDLDSTRVELFWHEHRSAELCLRSIRDGILNRHGKFDELRSDHAREFIGRIMSGLKQELGFKQTTTGGYHAKGNSKMERFWRYFGMAIRSLSDEQYAHAQDYIQSIVFAWNTTMSESLTVSPFEVHTGTQARTIADGFLTQRVSDEPIKIASITSAAAEFTRIARAHADFARKITAEGLNSRGRLLKPLKVGDMVKIFQPPSHAEAVRRRRKQKHMCPWTGPMKVTKKISGTHYLLENHYHPGKTYERHITNLRRWVGPIPEDEPLMTRGAPSGMSDIEVGDIVAARDTPTSPKVDIAEVTAVTDEAITLSCFGTRNGTPGKAKFHPVFTKGEAVYLGKPRGVSAKRWTWHVQVCDVGELMPITGLTMTQAGKLSSRSVRAFKAVRPKLVVRTF